MVDQSDPLGFLAAQQRAPDQKFLGLVDADKQRPDHRSAVARDEADTRDMGVPDAGVFGHHGNVAQQRMGRCKTDGIAIDGGDDRLVQLKLASDAAPADHGIMHLALLENIAAGPLRHRLHITPDAEIIAGASQHHGTDGVIVREIVPDRPQLTN